MPRNAPMPVKAVSDKIVANGTNTLQIGFYFECKGPFPMDCLQTSRMLGRKLLSPSS